MIDFTTLNISQETKKILSDFHIDFVFQPIFDRNNDIYAYEALMRPENIFISDFIQKKKAEDKLHELELATFFGALYAFRKRGYQTKININSFPSEHLSKEELSELLHCFPGMDQDMIIEILEHTDYQENIWKEKIKMIKSHSDIKIALDDFGTGYNNLSSVQHYNPQIIKLDRSLIKNVHIDANKAGIISSLIRYFHELGAKVLAEGIELEEEYNLLKAIGADYFQGYYLAKPM